MALPAVQIRKPMNPVDDALHRRAVELTGQRSLQERLVLSLGFLGLNFRPSVFDRVVVLIHSDEKQTIEIRDIASRNILKGVIVGGVAGIALSFRVNSWTKKMFYALGAAALGGIVGGAVTFVLPQPKVATYLSRESYVLKSAKFRAIANRLIEIDPRFERFLCPITNDLILDPVRVGNVYYERQALMSFLEGWYNARQEHIERRSAGDCFNAELCRQLEDPNYMNCPFRAHRLTVEQVESLPFDLLYLQEFKDMATEEFRGVDQIFRNNIASVIGELNITRIEYIAQIQRSVLAKLAQREISNEDYNILSSYLGRLVVLID